MKDTEIIKGLLDACETLMDEVCQKKATKWGVVNDAMVAAEKYLKVDKEEWTNQTSVVNCPICKGHISIKMTVKGRPDVVFDAVVVKEEKEDEK